MTQPSPATAHERAAYVPPAKYTRSGDGAQCCPHATPVGPGSCEYCWELHEAACEPCWTLRLANAAKPSPADTLRAAAEKLRGRTNVGAYTATPAGAALLRAREPLAEWLDQAARTAVWGHSLFADSDSPDEFVQPHALAVARAILGDQT